MNKRKNEQNPIVYWWNEFLFARYFEYETDLTPQEIAERLQALAHSRQGWMWGLETKVKTTLHPNEKGIDFDVQSRRRRLFDPIGITTARTLGTARVDSATGMAHVQGDVKLGRFIQIFFVLYVALVLMVFIPLFLGALPLVTDAATILGMSLPILIIGLVFGLLWLRIYTDRNNLAALFEDAIHSEKAKRASKRLAEDDADADNIATSDDDAAPHQKRRNL